MKLKFKKAFKRILFLFIGFMLLVILFREFLLSKYNPVNEVSILNNYNQQLFNDVFSIKDGWCPCEDIEMEVLFATATKSKLLINQKVMASKYQRELTIEQCLNYSLRRTGFSYNIDGVHAASMYYFKKNLEDLNKAEVYALLLMRLNSRKFDVKRNPKLMRQYQDKFPE